MSFNIQDLYVKLGEGDVLLAYKGSITSDLINNVLDALETKLIDFNEQSKTRKKVYNVLVESLQNLYHHIDDLPQVYKDRFDARFGILIVTKEDHNYKISTGNFIHNDKIEQLKTKIDQVNSLSQTDLKEMYKDILRNEKLTAKGGGGLGLVDIARKTGNFLKYNFEKFDDEYYFFILDVLVSESTSSS
ncbi:MAG: SiaB family protein kinase [Bacteroidales bacterium]|nr:SiaB family protein kinase [Bacteroidales bacterium]